MVTDYPHQVASRESFETGNHPHRADDGLATRVLNQVRQTFCGMHGHDSLVQFERDRMFLRCVSCGHESPGWALDKTPPTVKTRDDARRPALSPQLVGVRRIA
jgi:Zn ribbon nucleic-acid-binding protein